MIQPPVRVIGRFAPSPTGELHFGSLIAALASCCDARRQQGLWQLRIDDIDPPREVAGATDSILRTLDAYGFEWDGEVIFQSHHLALYQQALDSLQQSGLLYACQCSRRKLAGTRVYPGTCRPSPDHSSAERLQSHVRNRDAGRQDAGSLNTGHNTARNQQFAEHALRIRLQGHTQFADRIQGMQSVDVALTVGDIVLRRRDGLMAYALACAVDDADGVTHVVRGADLLPTTAAQIAVMQALGCKPPCYAHLPVAVNHAVQKLSKQTHAVALTVLPPLATLLQAWHFLGQAAIDARSLAEFWTLAPCSWQLDQVPRELQMRDPGAGHEAGNVPEPRPR